MGSRDDDDRVLPTPPPRGPALVRPTAGVLVLTLAGVVGTGCTKRGDGHPPMPPDYGPPPMPADSGEPPMAEELDSEEMPPMPDEGMEPPMPEPHDEPIPPMPAPPDGRP